MIRKFAIAIAIVLVVVGAIAGVKTLQIRKLIANGKAFTVPPETVSTAVAREVKWQATLSAIGTIVAAQGVTLTPDIPGTVREIVFESGTVVARSNLLVRLDTSSEDAQLRAIQAQVELAQINLDRMATLRTNNMVAQSELDTAVATLKQSQANADVISATIAKKTIRAPFAGRLGIRLVNLGQYLDLGKPIVSLQSLAPVYADFSLPQQELARLQTGMQVRVTTDTYPNEQFDGTLTAINPDLDQGTRSVSLQATFANADERLRPGMFARVEVLLPGEQTVLVIPKTSVLSAPFGDSIYLVEEQARTNGAPAGLTVRQQIIRTGPERVGLLSVESGLKAGERVVSAGLFKLRNGMAVVENNTLTPKIEAALPLSDN
jgi:membrane fusion protein (multidrug efflux system)